MTLIEYDDITLYELTILIEGYNVRWEERWMPFRRLYTLLYNVNSGKNDQKREIELMPFPSEMVQLERLNRIEKKKMAGNLVKK